MSGDVTIRAATVDDVLAVAEFQTTTWNETYDGLVRDEYNARTTVEARAVRWGERIAGEREVRIAEKQGRVVAVMSFGQRRDDRAGADLELMSLYLAPDVRGTGLADELVEEAIGRKAAVVWVFEANARAIAFYRRRGFEPDGESMFDVDTGLPEIRMVKRSADT